MSSIVNGAEVNDAHRSSSVVGPLSLQQLFALKELNKENHLEDYARIYNNKFYQNAYQKQLHQDKMLQGYLHKQNELNFKTNPASNSRKSKSGEKYGANWSSKPYREAFPPPSEMSSKPHEVIAMSSDFDANMIQKLFPDRAIKAQNFIDLLSCNRKNDKQP